MDPLVLKRGGLRSSFTKTANVFRTEIGKEEFSEGVLKDKFTKLRKVNKDIEELNEQILSTLTDGGATQDKITEEMEGWDRYSDEFITISRLFVEKIGNLELGNLEGENLGTRSQGSHASELSPRYVRSFKLPKIELKKFNGELLSWLPFWSQFEKIHEDPVLHDSDKFQYLVQSMESGTRAREFIASYPMTAKNYPKAIKALKERFGNPDLLIEVYVRELLKLIISNARVDKGERLILPRLFDKIEAHLGALESLGIKSESNSCWLYPMVESSLSEEVLRAWQRSSLFREIDESKNITRLANLIKFLKYEVEGEERLRLAREGFEDFKQKDKHYDKPKREFRDRVNSRQSRNVPTAAGFFVAKDHGCIFCSKLHDSRDCYEARSLSLEDKKNKIKLKRCCLKCLAPGHIAKTCRQFIRCYSCGKAHVIALCPEMHKGETREMQAEPEVVQTTTVGQVCSTEVALMTIKVNVLGKTTSKEVRALLDCGSQKSYILRSTAKELGLTPVAREVVAHTLFGGARTEPRVHDRYRIKLRSSNPHAKREFEFEFLDQAEICGSVARMPKGPFLKELKGKGVWLSDIGSGCPKIEILIGSDIYGKILTGKVKQLRGGLTAIDTRLGWTVCGRPQEYCPSEKRDIVNLNVNLAIRDFNVADLWSLETLGIKDAGVNVTKSAEEDMARQQFLRSLGRNDDGRYCVGLPWLDRDLELPSNRHIAERRLFSTTRKLRALGLFEEYDKVFSEWLMEGVIEEVPIEDLESRVHYLPHHPVIKPDSLTTKIRPVFDASCKANRSPSLNDCLVKGPNLIEEIPALLLRFREKCIAVTADIRRAFLQIELKREDRNFLRFLWWDKDNNMKIYRHTRVVFGVKSTR